MSKYAINIVDDYEVPKGKLDKAQYVDFVMNMAAQSYQRQYGVDGADAGVQAALDAYNENVPEDIQPQ